MPLSGGAVARSVEQLTLHLARGRGRLELVRKDASALEIAGLRAAQPVRGSQATVIAELVAWGRDWLVTPLAPGAALSWGDAVPDNLFESLAALHARYTGDAGLPAVIPRVDQGWWASLGQDWVAPRLRSSAARHPSDLTARAQSLVSRAGRLPAVATVLNRLPATLPHGDVHPGNVLVSADQATLIDWGGCRVGPAALDLANLVTADSPSVARYASAWRRVTGQPLSGDMTELGYRWAALQIPVPYLPWIAAHRATGDYAAALDRIEEAADDLSRRL